MKNPSERKCGIFLSCLKAQCVWFVAAVIILFAFCIVSYSTSDPDAVTHPLSLCALYLSAIAGGIAAVKFSGDGIASGALSGLITAVIVFCMSCIPFPSSGYSIGYSLLLTSLVIPASVIGSVLSHKKKGSEKKMKKRMNKKRSL